MSIGIASTSNYHQPENIKAPPPPPPPRAEKENDGDKDDGASSRVSATAPTVNTLGQTIGSTISVTA